MCGEERRGSPEAVLQFRHRLASLKREGSNILLVGSDAAPAACERLLGESDARPRRRLLVTTDAGATDARARLDAVDGRIGRNAAAVVDWQVKTRSAAADSSEGAVSAGESGDAEGTEGSPVGIETVDGDLRALGTTVESVVERFDEASDGLEPAELRLCFDSLTPLVANRDLRDASRFLLALTETVKRVDGMAHFHLPTAYDSEVVTVLEPLFDAAVEVRRTDRAVQQRWHLSDAEITTEWLTL